MPRLAVLLVAFACASLAQERVPAFRSVALSSLSSPGPSGSAAAFVTQCGVDNNREVYIGGAFASEHFQIGNLILTNGGAFNAFAMKLDENLDPIWARSSDGNTDTTVNGFVVDPAGNLYIDVGCRSATCRFDGLDFQSSSNRFSVVFKYAPSGQRLWCRQIDGAAGMGWESALATDGGSNVLLAALCEDNSLLLTKLDFSGTPMWLRREGRLSSNENISLSLASDAAGNATIAGSFTTFTAKFGNTTLTNYGKRNMFLAKYDAAGNSVWAKSIGGTSWDAATDLCLDATGNCYVIGETYSSVLPSVTSPNLVAFGDSITAGFDVSESANFVSLLAQGLELNPVNLGENGAGIINYAESIFGYQASEGDLLTYALGISDALHGDDGGILTRADRLPLLKAMHMAEVLWLCVPAGQKRSGKQMFDPSNTWTETTVFATSVASKTAGAVLDCGTFFGNKLFLSYTAFSRTNGGDFAVIIDGQSAGTFSCRAPIDMTTTFDPYVSTAPYLQTFDVPLGDHTVQIQVLSPTGDANIVEINYIVGLDGLTHSDWPAVFVGNLTPCTADFISANVLSQPALTQFSQMIADNCKILASYGLNAFLVDTMSAIDPYSDSIDGIHPNAAGYAKLATTFDRSMNGLSTEWFGNERLNLTASHCFIGKFDSAGEIAWIQRVADTSEPGTPLRIALDNDSNVYVSVASDSTEVSTVSPSFLAKFNNEGALLWRKTVNTDVGQAESNARRPFWPQSRIVVDSTGSLVVSGSLSLQEGTCAFDSLTFDATSGGNFIARLTYDPLLIINCTGNEVFLHWPTNETGFTLESNAELTASGWCPVTNSVEIVGEENLVTTSVSVQPVFYRLRK